LVLAEKEMLSRLIKVQLLLQKATDDDKAAGKKNAEARISSMLDRAGSQDALDQQIKSAGMTEDEFRTKITQEAIATVVLQRELGAGTSTTGDEANKYMSGFARRAAKVASDFNRQHFK
jgi:hypothetical protein